MPAPSPPGAGFADMPRVCALTGTQSQCASPAWCEQVPDGALRSSCWRPDTPPGWRKLFSSPHEAE
jgi:hypothetical protein